MLPAAADGTEGRWQKRDNVLAQKRDQTAVSQANAFVVLKGLPFCTYVDMARACTVYACLPA